MGIGEIGWMVYLAGLPFAQLVIRSVDIWHTQTAFAQAGIAGVFALLLVQTQRPIVRNLPLACWTAWVSWQTLYIWQSSLLGGMKEYPSALLMPWLNTMSLTFFYLAAVTQWTLPLMEELCRWLSRAAAVIVVLGGLQLLNLDQFHRHIENFEKDPLIGTIGNPSHFGVHLALLLPLVLMRKQWYWKGLAGLMVGMILLTNSAMGMLGGLIALTWWCFWRRKRLVWLPICLSVLAVILIARHPLYLNPEGRVGIWKMNWQDYADTTGVPRNQAKPTITGFGLGYIRARSATLPEESPLRKWRHVHNAPFQVLIELGVIGCGILLWGLCAYWKQFWRVRAHPLATVCGAIFLIFSLSTLLHFTDHLWVTASLGLFGYCGVYVLSTEQKSLS